jgi:eukaryotic-like serine/threonine-protein kinase
MPESEPMEIGANVTPHVRLESHLMGGEMGDLWVGVHETLGMRVAVKFVHARYRKDPVALERFHREARSAARVDSPHVVTVHDFGTTDDGSAYIVMELLAGESLRARLEREGPLSLQETACVVLQVAHALEAAHAVGVVHRDVKPDNIFLCDTHDGSPFVKLLDFGVASDGEARDGRRLTSPGTLVGTPAYMSPELIREGDSGPPTDVWALAVSAYEMLAGELPFWGDSVPDVCASITEGIYTPPSQLVPSLDAEVDAVFERVFAREIAERHASSCDFARDLIAHTPDGPRAPTASGLRMTPAGQALANPASPPQSSHRAERAEPDATPTESDEGLSARSRRLWAIALASALAMVVVLGQRALDDPPTVRSNLTASALSLYAALAAPSETARRAHE